MLTAVDVSPRWYKERIIHLKKFAALLLAFTLVMSTNLTAFAANPQPEETVGLIEQMLDDPDFLITQEPSIADDASVMVIVELEEQPGISLFNAQKSLEETIAEDILKQPDLKPAYSYSQVVNGFAMEMPYGKLEEVRALPGVERAYVAPQFQLEPDAEPNTTLMGGMSNMSGFDGQGMVIAVIDSGMEVNHPAFQGDLHAPALTKADVESLLSTKELKAETLSYNLTVDQVYKSAKVPFAYDYADRDSDVSPTYDDHGTHVSGIAAGMTEQANGVAPQAQILALKTFSSYGAAGWDAILAALDDAVTLGADVINMSLGMASGFSSPESDQAMHDALQAVSDAGVLIAAAAGNEYNAAYGGKVGRDRPLTVNPDYGTMDTPASLSMTLAVASVEKEGTVESSYLTASDGTIMAFWDTAETASAPAGALQFKSLGENPVSYVVVPGHGAASDYAGLKLEGKVALVQRGGGVTYDEMKNAAKAAKASGLLVYNNVPGMLYMGFTTYDLPAAFLSQADGERLKGLPESQRTLTIAMETGNVSSPTSGQMSDFSAWGVTPELKLKPEITAPGGNIESAVGTSTYGVKSGTSMATPFVAGSMAVVSQYLQQNHPTVDLDRVTSSLLMSTADLVETKGVPYSPRKQGAGSVNVDHAILSPAYLEVSGQTVPKLEVGDDVQKKGVYELQFQVCT